MKCKLILLSKESSPTPLVSNTRPISILPSITKLFEQSIISNLEDVVLNKLSPSQRGFIPGRSVFDNLKDIFQECLRIRVSRGGLLVFLDLKRAYDNVDRNKLFMVLEDIGVPSNFINLLSDMYSKISITIDGKNFIRTSRGLLQGSTMSPLLFDIYVDSLIRRLEEGGTMVRAFADDLVFVLDNSEKLDDKLRTVVEWGEEYGISLNTSKSGIVRILRRSSKIMEVPNILGIKEVTEYKYLGIWVNQSLNFAKHIKSVKSKSNVLWKNTSVCYNSSLGFHARRLVYKSIVCQML
jgi:hypothetical protein